MNNILLTSGYNFEGYSISEYLGVYSGECALGTGFLSTLGASLADFLGSNSTMYSDKLKTAKTYAMEQLMTRVENAGGNAIIGLDIDYTTFSADIMGVIANGTAVKITKNVNAPLTKPKTFPIRATNPGMPFIPAYVLIDLSQNFASISLDIYCPVSFDLETAASAPKDSDMWVFNFEAFMKAVLAYNTAKEILEFLNEYNEEHPNTVSPLLIEEIVNLVSLERIYGNMQKSAVNKIQDFFLTHDT